MTHDLVVVSNRLPIDLDEETGTWRPAPGGLVAALGPVLRGSGACWVGWPGAADVAFAPFAMDDLTVVSVALSQQDLVEYYEGFANDTVWPLYHDVIVAPSFHREWWDRYRDVNERFAETAASAVSYGGTVWVHDYQLQLVPEFLRARRPDLRIGYFNHIPFPESTLFAQLPWRRQVLHGLLGADLIGFQRAADAGNFLSSVRRLLGYRTNGPEVVIPGSSRRVTARHVPISIDAAGCDALAREPAILARARDIRGGLGNPAFVLSGADRLDYTKGIAHRLKAFGELLDDGRLAVDQVSMMLIASPSRERVPSYQNTRGEIELLVGRINGTHQQLGRPPITYLHQALSREEMVALYRATDVMLVTALRDGMNLVAKEYVASRVDEDGVLVLSEFAGAADELRGAILINPHDIDGLKDAIMAAISMPQAERRRRMRQLRRRLWEHDVRDWAGNFLTALRSR